MKTQFPAAAAAIATLLAAGAAQAQDNVFKTGGILYQTHSKTTGIKGIGVPPGADADVGDATTLLLTYERMFNKNWGVELVIGIPPTIKARATGSVAFLGDDVLSAKNIAPTLIANYHFGQSTDTLRPYLGAGINYTRFASAKTSLAPSVELKDSVGPVVQAGADYAINRQWGLFASIAKVWVKSDLVAVSSTVLTTTIDFRPITYSIGVSYKF